MPVQFLTDEERERLSRFPEQIEEEDLIAFFTLSPADIKEIQKQRGEQNKLGYAIQLCALRYMGFSPDEVTDSPPDIIKYMAKQLRLNPESLSGYGRRAPTRTSHFQRARQYLDFQKAGADYLQSLSKWIVDRALEHENPLLLLNLSFDKLIKDKIVRPGITRLERMVATAINKANKKTFNQLKHLLTANRRSFLRKYYDEQQNQAACLNLVTNIVITWYTVYIAYAIEQLKTEGYPVNDEDVSYQWPTKFAGINVHGKINFNIDEELKRNGLRPLRKPDGD